LGGLSCIPGAVPSADGIRHPEGFAYSMALALSQTSVTRSLALTVVDMVALGAAPVTCAGAL
jgi:hypothetical protein